MSRRTLFRKEAVDRLRSPDEVDQLLQVVNRRSWIPLVVVGALLAFALTWSVVDEIPETVEGRGILVYVDSIVPFQAKVDGQVTGLKAPLERVEAGGTLAEIERPELEDDLSFAIARHGRAVELEKRLENERDAWAAAERKAIDDKDAALDAQLEKIKATREALAGAEVAVETGADLKTVRDAIAKSREMESTLRKTLDRWDKEARDTGNTVISEVDRLNLRQKLADAVSRTAGLMLREQEIAISRIRLQDAGEMRAQRRLQLDADEARIAADKKDLVIRRAEIDRRLGQWKMEQETRLAALDEEVQRLTARKNVDPKVVAPAGGIVRELSVSADSWVKAGQRLGMFQKDVEGGPAAPLTCLAYFSVGDGMRIRKGLDVQVSLDSVKRERHGSIVAEVVSDPKPISRSAVERSLGNSELTERLMAGGRLVQVEVKLFPAELAGRPGDGGRPKGARYRWTSRSGVDADVAAGTTATVRVELESNKPIYYALPFLKDLFERE